MVVDRDATRSEMTVFTDAKLYVILINLVLKFPVKLKFAFTVSVTEKGTFKPFVLLKVTIKALSVMPSVKKIRETKRLLRLLATRNSLKRIRKKLSSITTLKVLFNMLLRTMRQLKRLKML